MSTHGHMCIVFFQVDFTTEHVCLFFNQGTKTPMEEFTWRKSLLKIEALIGARNSSFPYHPPFCQVFFSWLPFDVGFGLLDCWLGGTGAPVPFEARWVLSAKSKPRSQITKAR